MADVSVTLGLNAAQLSTGLKRATTEVDGFARRAKDSFGKIGGGISSMASGLGTAIAGLAVGSKIQSTIEHFSRISDLASRFDVSTDALQRLNFAASMSGTDLETAARALTILNKALDDPANKKATEAFERLGLSIKSLRQADSFQQIQMLSAAFQKAQATGDGFSDIMALLGKSGAELIPMLRLSAEELDKFSKTDVVSSDQVAQLEEMGDQLDAIKIKVTTLFGQGIIGGVKVFGALADASRDMGTYVAIFESHLRNGLNVSEAIRKTDEELNNIYKDRAKIKKEEADAEAKKPKPEKIIGERERDTGEAKKNTYDVAKNIQEQARIAESILDPYRQFLDYLEEEKRKLDAIKKQKDADAKASQTKIQSQKEAAQALQDEMRLLEARASGDEKAIKAAEREIALKQKARDIQTQLQIDAKTALDIAKQMQALEDKAEKATDRPEGRIQGYSSERQGGREGARARAAQRASDSATKRAGAYGRAFGGLAEFERNQKDPNFARPLTPSLDAMKNPGNPSTPVVGAVQSLEQTIKQLLTVD